MFSPSLFDLLFRFFSDLNEEDSKFVTQSVIFKTVVLIR